MLYKQKVLYNKVKHDIAYTLGPLLPLLPPRSAPKTILLLVSWDTPDQRHHRFVPRQRRRFLDVRDRRVVDHDRAGAAVEGEAKRRECARECRHVIIGHQQLPET